MNYRVDTSFEPTCNRTECFGNSYASLGRETCSLLRDTKFEQRGGGVEVCPFFKTREQYAKDRAKYDIPYGSTWKKKQEEVA